MKTFYYSIATTKQNWSDELQYFVNFPTWEEFAMFCKKIAESQKVTVRGCTSWGYNNQGYYFN